jgi:hypothetical protein
MVLMLRRIDTLIRYVTRHDRRCFRLLHANQHMPTIQLTIEVAPITLMTPLGLTDTTREESERARVSEGE